MLKSSGQLKSVNSIMAPRLCTAATAQTALLTVSALTASLALTTVIALTMTLAAPVLTFAQAAGSAGSTINVERTPYLSFVEIPTSFTFAATTTGGSSHHIFNAPDGPLAEGKFLAVSDTRNSGGFVIQAQSTDFTSSSSTIAAANLRVVSTSSLSYDPGSTIVNNIHYYTGYAGTPDVTATQTIAAPVNAASTNFGQTTTFDEVQNRPEINSLDAPVDILSGCLPATQGRIGTMGVGLAFDLLVPAYAVPGIYDSTITYTIIDYTEVSCP